MNKALDIENMSWKNIDDK